MSVPDATGTRTRSTADAHAACRDLRAEKVQVLRWRRLLRARLDLAVAAYVPPDELGTSTWDLAPAVHLGLPPAYVLAHAVHVPAAADGVALMERLRMLDRLLAAYGDGLDDALEASIDEVVGGLVARHSQTGGTTGP